MAPRIRNSMQIEVLPVPTEPEMRTVFPRGMPPFRMWSIASIPVTHRSRSSSACSFVGIDSGVQTGCSLFEMNALSIRLENSDSSGDEVRGIGRPRDLSTVDDSERVIPSAELQADEDPEGNRRLEPPCALDPSDVDGPGPSELLEDADDLLFRRRVVAADQHFGIAARELGIDHLCVRDRVEALHDLGVRDPPLDAFAEGIVRADEEARGPSL